MGRTNPTFRDRLRRFEEDWQPFRRGLRSEHQADFDRLIEMAERFAAAAGYQNPAHPYRAIVVSILVAQEVDRRRLEARVTALEADDDAV